MNEQLIDALKDFLADTFRDRHYCPRCMGMLPDKHDADCKLGRLALAYAGAELPPLVLPKEEGTVYVQKASKARAKTNKPQPLKGTPIPLF